MPRTIIMIKMSCYTQTDIGPNHFYLNIPNYSIKWSFLQYTQMPSYAVHLKNKMKQNKWEEQSYHITKAEA